MHELCTCFNYLATDCRLIMCVYEVTFVPLTLQRDLGRGRRAASGELLFVPFLTSKTNDSQPIMGQCGNGLIVAHVII